MSQHYPKLFSPFTLGGIELKNRVVMAPMSTEYGGTDGSVTPRNIAFYRERALGGFGLIIVEFTCVDPSTGRTEAHQLSLESRRNLDGHKRLVDAVKGAGAKVFVQLQHGGRFADRKFVSIPKGPSVVMSRRDPSKMVSDAFSNDEIEALVDAFARTARLSKEAGYDGIEVHAAHGYLVSQFMSPLGNQRDDEWGGDLERRMAFPCAISRAIKSEIGDLPLVFRISADEYLPGGVTLEDSEYNARRLVDAGADMIHVSSGRGPDSFERVMEPMSSPEGWRVPLARRIREVTGVPVITVGQIRTPEVAEQAISDGSADLVALGRPSLADAHWPNKVAAGRYDDVRPCTSCNWCISGAMRPMSCAENPRTGFELDPEIPADLGAGQRAAVIGAGPGGMSAALMLQQAGFDTHLFEASATLGGGLIASAEPPGKDKFYWYRDYLVRKIENSGIKLALGQRVSAQDIQELGADVVFVAAGSTYRPMAIDGIDSSIVLDAYEVLMGRVRHGLKTGQSVVIYGGGETGCETAEYFAERELKVTLISRSPAKELARSAEMVYRKMLIGRLMQNPSIELITDTHITHIDDEGVKTECSDRGTVRVKADRVIIAQGRDSESTITQSLLASTIPCYVIGDSHQIGRVGHAVHDAYRALQSLAANRRPSWELAC